MFTTSKPSLATSPKARKRRLAVLGQFFRFARAQHVVLIDPTRNMTSQHSKGFRGSTLTLDQQRCLFRRWTTSEKVHPHEAVVGILALLHGASNSEVRMLQVNDVDQQAQTVRLGKRPPRLRCPAQSAGATCRCRSRRSGRAAVPS